MESRIAVWLLSSSVLLLYLHRTCCSFDQEKMKEKYKSKKINQNEDKQFDTIDMQCGPTTEKVLENNAKQQLCDHINERIKENKYLINKYIKYTSVKSKKKSSKCNINNNRKNDTNIWKQLTRLKHMRILAKRQVQKNVNTETVLSKKFPTTYHTVNFFSKPDIALKGTLDYIQGVSYYAFKGFHLGILNEALNLYEKILLGNRNSLRTLFQKADTLALISMITESKTRFEKAFATFQHIIQFPNLSDHQFMISSHKAVALLEHFKFYKRALDFQLDLSIRFPKKLDVLNHLGRLYQKVGDLTPAKDLFHTSIRKNKDNNIVAIANYGYILYVESLNIALSEKGNNSESRKLLDHSINLIKKVIRTRSSNRHIADGYLFSLCGYALLKLGRRHEANQIFEEAADADVFPSFWQRTSFVHRVRSKPTWTLHQTNISYLLKEIIDKWKLIRDEAYHILNSNFFDTEVENLTDTGKWAHYYLYGRGTRIHENCLKAPLTCSLIDRIPHIVDNGGGDVLFSHMHSGTHVAQHCGPTNTRLRLHLGLDVPKVDNNSTNAPPLSRIRVKNEYLTWRNGEIIIFDDSFDHEVWHFHPNNHSRLILIIDILHPNMNEYQISNN